jgi:hypothetical protein
LENIGKFLLCNRADIAAIFGFPAVVRPIVAKFSQQLPTKTRGGERGSQRYSPQSYSRFQTNWSKFFSLTEFSQRRERRTFSEAQ